MAEHVWSTARIGGQDWCLLRNGLGGEFRWWVEDKPTSVAGSTVEGARNALETYLKAGKTLEADWLSARTSSKSGAGDAKASDTFWGTVIICVTLVILWSLWRWWTAVDPCVAGPGGYDPRNPADRALAAGCANRDR